MEIFLQFLVLVVVNLGIAILAGLIFGKTHLLDEKQSRLPAWLRTPLGVVIFGIFSIIGTATAMNYNGALLNVRDAPVISGGVWFGPAVGMGAAVIGAGYRFLLGGPTLIPCCISTLAAGVLASVLYVWFRPVITVMTATLIAVIVGLLHMILLLTLTADDMGLYLAMETPTAIGILILTAVSVALFSWVYEISSRPNKK